MLLAELEADGASEINKLLLAEAAMEPRPELVVRAIRVVRDRVGPLERGTRWVVEACRVCHFGIVGEVPVAELLDALVGDAPIEDVLAYVAPARERVRHQRADLIGRRAEPRH